MRLENEFNLKFIELDKLCKKLYPKHSKGVEALKEFANSLAPNNKTKLLDFIDAYEKSSITNINEEAINFLNGLLHDANIRILSSNFSEDMFVLKHEEDSFEKDQRYYKNKIEEMYSNVIKYTRVFQKSIKKKAKQELENAFREIDRCKNFDELLEVEEKYEEIFDELEDLIDYDL